MSELPDYDDIETILNEDLGDPTRLIRLFPNFVDDWQDSGCELDFFQTACQDTDINVIKGMVKCCGSELLSSSYYYRPYSWHCIALHAACSGADTREGIDLIRWILEQPAGLATINSKDADMQETPLHKLIKSDCANTSVAFLLLKCGANPWITNKLGEQPAQHSKRTPGFYAWKMEFARVLQYGEDAWEASHIGKEWRPTTHALFPASVRITMRTLVVLAKARLPQSIQRYSSHYTESCLELLPEEVLQYMYVYLASPPFLVYFLPAYAANSYGYNKFQ